MPQQDAWGTDNSSGFLNNYIGTVTDSFFATNPKIGEGQQLLLHWQTTIDDAGDVEVSPETLETGLTQIYSVGGKWVSEDGGKTAVHPDGGNKKFHATSLYGKIIDSVLGTLDAYGDNATDEEGQPVKVKLDGLKDVVMARGNPQQADVWNGLRFRFQEVHFDYGTDKAGKPIKGVRAMPVEYIGVAGATKEPTAKEKAAAAKAKAAEKKAKAAGTDSTTDVIGELLTAAGADDATVQGIRNALDVAATQVDFVDACLEIDDVPTNDALMELVVDDGSDGLWAKAGK